MIDLKQPNTFSEKLQWLKLHDRKPEYTGVYDSPENIDWDYLPNSFVLKCTHGSSSNIICEDKSKLDIRRTKKS